MSTPGSVVTFIKGDPMMTTLALVLAAGLTSETVTMQFLEKGATAKTGGYRPMRVELSDNADAVKTPPAELKSPKYGVLKIGNSQWGVILDEPSEGDAKLFLDSNNDGDYTNDPKTTWSPQTTNNLTMHRGEAQVDLGEGKRGSLGAYRFDPKDPARAQLKNFVLFYTDYGYEFSFELDGRAFSTFVSGQPQANSALWIDRDGNKRPSQKREMAVIGKPFNFTGTTYVFRWDGAKMALETAPEALPMSPLPPNTAVGAKAIPFAATSMDGKAIEFPKTYAGKIVMLDFWATWCGPCVAEIPNMKKAYEAHHEKGFEILGISFDQENMAEKVTAFTKERGMAWPQVYEGKFWDTTLGELYDVSGIPFVLLVDGDTGEILGTAKELRGPGLADFIGKTLAKKSSPQ